MRLEVGNFRHWVSVWVGWIMFVFWGSGLMGQAAQSIPVLSHNTTSFHSTNTHSQIVHNADGTVIVGWQSARIDIPYGQIYLQKLDAEGKSLWERDGTPVCPYPAHQSNFQMVPDGNGGVIVAWEDQREGADDPAIFVQRINERGEPLWGWEGMRICERPGAQRHPKMVEDGAAGFYLVWEDHRAGLQEKDIYGQHFDLSGTRNWRHSGMPISTSPSFQQNISVATDENHDLFLVWEDFRNELYWNLFAQKIDRAGNFLWGNSGLDIFSGVEENHQQPHIVPDGLGGLLFVYQKYSDLTDGTDIYRGRLDKEGKLLFHFATCFSQNEQLNPRIVRKGSKAILVWEDRRNGNWDIYGQMIRLRDGILEWGINGVPIVKSPDDERSPEVFASTTYAYQVFSWVRRVGNERKVLVQKCDNLGERLWTERGRPVCSTGASQYRPAIIPDERGGLWCSWSDRRKAGEVPIFVQRLSGLGEQLLSPGGVKLAAMQQASQAKIGEPVFMQVRSGAYFMAWSDHRNGEKNADVYLQKLNDAGQPQWRTRGIPISIANGNQERPVLVDDGVGGVIVVWSDFRKGYDEDLYAQRVNASGKLLWEYNGKLICDAASSQTQVVAVPDGQEGMVLTWVDARNLKATGFDIYLQRVDHSGNSLWGHNGKPFAALNGLQSSPAMVADGEGGAFLAWMDYRGEQSNIYMQRIDRFGFHTWQRGGILLAESAANQRNPVIAINSKREVCAVWQEGRYGDGFEKLFMQKVTADGMTKWGFSGRPVCNYPGRQSYPKVAIGPEDKFYVAWLDERTRNYHGVRLLTQQFNSAGEEQWRADGIPIGDHMKEYNPFGLAVDQGGKSYYFWNQKNFEGHLKCYYQELTVGGEKKFDYGGKPLESKAIDEEWPGIIASKNGGVLKKWGKNGGRGLKTEGNVIPLGYGRERKREGETGTETSIQESR